jgi:predicted XRE-type DNA-binding protein
MTMKIQQSTGNVFRDLGFDPNKAESLRLRAGLMVEIKRLIQARKLSQSSAANIFGVTQPRISDLIRGKIDLFSIDTLVNMLARAGMRVQLRLARAGSGRRAQAA